MACILIFLAYPQLKVDHQMCVLALVCSTDSQNFGGTNCNYVNLCSFHPTVASNSHYCYLLAAHLYEHVRGGTLP